MTDNKETFETIPEAQVGVGSVATHDATPAPAEEKKKPEAYYNVKIPTLSTALKQLWKVGKNIAKKADPIADKAIDTLVGGIAKVSGLPNPKTGEKKIVQKPQAETPVPTNEPTTV